MPRGRKPKIAKPVPKKEKVNLEGNYILYRMENKPTKAKIEKQDKEFIITIFYSSIGPVKETYTKAEIECLILEKSLKKQEEIL
jgi:hypothetical protein